MELAFQHQAAYGYIQDQMAEIEEEEHLNPKVETPLEQKVVAAEVEKTMEKAVVDLQEVETMIVPSVEDV